MVGRIKRFEITLRHKIQRHASSAKYCASAAEPKATFKKWAYSRVDVRAQPSTMLVATDTAARRN